MSRNRKDGEAQPHIGKVIVTKDGYDVIECELCGFKHIMPLPEESIKKKFYSEKFYEEEKQNYIGRHQEDFEWWSIEHNEKYESQENIGYRFRSWVFPKNRQRKGMGCNRDRTRKTSL